MTRTSRTRYRGIEPAFALFPISAYERNRTPLANKTKGDAYLAKGYAGGQGYYFYCLCKIKTLHSWEYVGMV